jgi:hypothetical protein
VADVDLAVVLRRVYQISFPIVILEYGHVSAFIVMWSLAVEVQKWACRRVTDSHAY